MINKFWDKNYNNNFKRLNTKRRNCFRDKLNLVFKTIRKSEYIHPKCREQVIKEIKETL
jgi:hypothetical protein